MLRGAAALAVIACLLAADEGRSAVTTWNGSADATWNNAGNWSGGAVPSLSDTAVFNNSGNARTTVDFSATGGSAAAVLFDSSAAAAYILGAGAINSQSFMLADGGSLTMNSTVAANQTIDAAVTLGSDATAQSYTFTNNSSTNSLIVAGNIVGGSGGSAGIESLTIAGGATLSGAIGNGGAAAVALAKTGPGTLTLSGPNTYSGGTTIGGGTVNANSATAFGAATGPLAVNNPNTGVGTAVVVNINSSMSVGPLSGAIAAPAGGTNTATINIQSNNSVLTVNQTADSTFAGSINAWGFTLGASSTKTLTLSGGVIDSNSGNGNGNIDISGGSINLVNGGQLSCGWVDNGQFYINSAAGSNGSNVTVSGSNSALSCGNGLYFSGGTGNSIVLENGTYCGPYLGYMGDAATSGSDSLTIAGAGTNFITQDVWIIGNAGIGHEAMSVLNGATAHTAQYSTHVTYVGNSSGTNYNSILVDGNGSVYSTEQLRLGNAANSTNNTMTVSDSGTVNGSASIVGVSSGSNFNQVIVAGGGSLWNLNNNTLIIGGNAAAANNAVQVISGGSLTDATTVTLGGQSSSLVVGDGNGLSTLAVNTVNLSTASASLNFNAGQLIATANGALLQGTGQVDLNGPAIVSTPFAASTIGLAMDGAGSLTKQGAGLLALTVANGYSGGTTVSTGTLQLGNNAALGTGGVTANGGVLDLAGFGPSVASLSGSAGTIVNSSATDDSVLTVNQALAPATTFSGTIQNGPNGRVVSLVKSGSGALTLAGTNGYSGGTTLNGGTLVVTNSGSLGNPSGALAIGAATLEVATGFSSGRTVSLNNNDSTIQVDDPSTPYALTGAVSGGGRLNKTGPGTLELVSGGSLTGSTYVVAGTLRIDGSWSTSVMNVTATGGSQGGGLLAGSGTLSVGGDGMFYSSTAASNFAGTLTSDSPDAGLEVDSGTLALSGPNGLQGGTLVAGGELILTSNLAIADGSSLTVGNAGLFPAAIVPEAGAELAPVPEPGSLVLILAATAVCLAFRRMFHFCLPARRPSIARRWRAAAGVAATACAATTCADSAD